MKLKSVSVIFIFDFCSNFYFRCLDFYCKFGTYEENPFTQSLFHVPTYNVTHITADSVCIFICGTKTTITYRGGYLNCVRARQIAAPVPGSEILTDQE